jgi:quinohemoprotein ethanol dehydrogenase
MRLSIALAGALLALFAANARAADPAQIAASTKSIDDARLRAAGDDTANWLSYGRTYSEQRFSPLAEISEANVGELGLLWSFDLGTKRGVEATPIVVDGVIYASGPWSVVWAVDARSGKQLWYYDPHVPRQKGRDACCDVVNRGVAVYKGKVFVGTIEGKLAALDAATGKELWSVLTVDPSRPYTITGAPRVVAGKVIIGNGGAELGVRGYVSAYNPDDGKLVWRTYTVPGDPSKPFESKALEAAARTWTGKWWEVGGGGTCWDAMAFDPELDLLYVGTGNGSPWSRYVRSPGGGDNLYVSSILALRPATGELVWHFQTTPGDNWDYTSTQHLILADLEIAGKPRKVIMQAPKNGFFWVIDRTNGQFISAKPYVEVTWARGIDEKGRPIEATDIDYQNEQKTVKPSPLGGHNWQPMSWNPKTGLVYIPTNDIAGIFLLDKPFKYEPGRWNTGTDFKVFDDLKEADIEDVAGALIAWDPVQQKEVWRVPYPTPWNGGTLTTAGNLVFQGTADGRFVAYRATDGKLLWQSPAGTGVIAGPATYTVDGKQYVTVMAGWGGAYALVYGAAARKAGVRSEGRMLTFALGGQAKLPDVAPIPRHPPKPTFELKASAEEIARGATLFHRNCATCHGLQAVGGGAISDLRFSTAETHGRWNDIVLGGANLPAGMPSFADVLKPEDTRLIQAYVLSRAATDAAPAAASGASE